MLIYWAKRSHETQYFHNLLIRHRLLEMVHVKLFLRNPKNNQSWEFFVFNSIFKLLISSLEFEKVSLTTSYINYTVIQGIFNHFRAGLCAYLHKKAFNQITLDPDKNIASLIYLKHFNFKAQIGCNVMRFTLFVNCCQLHSKN